MGKAGQALPPLIEQPIRVFSVGVVSPFWCFLCIKIFTVVSEAPLRLSLLRLRPLGGAVLTGGRVLSGPPEGQRSSEWRFGKAQRAFD